MHRAAANTDRIPHVVQDFVATAIELQLLGRLYLVKAPLGGLLVEPAQEPADRPHAARVPPALVRT